MRIKELYMYSPPDITKYKITTIARPETTCDKGSDPRNDIPLVDTAFGTTTGAFRTFSILSIYQLYEKYAFVDAYVSNNIPPNTKVKYTMV